MAAPVPAYPPAQGWISREERRNILKNSDSLTRHPFLGNFLLCWLTPNPLGLAGKCAIAALMTFAGYLFLDQPKSDLAGAVNRLKSLPANEQARAFDIAAIL